MTRPITFDETKALQLYEELKSDAEIAEMLGVPQSTIDSWRQRRKLPVIYQRPKPEVKPKAVRPDDAYQKHQDYRKVLSPEQCKQMNKFLHALLLASQK